MKLIYMKATLLLTLLAACRPSHPAAMNTSDPQNRPTEGALYQGDSLDHSTSASPTQTSTALPSATPKSNHKWIQYHSDEFGASFEYPTAYETGSCGHLYTAQRESDFSDYGFAGDEIISFEGATIEISMRSPWMGSFDDHIEYLLGQSIYVEEPITSDLLIDGLPAVRIQRFFQHFWDELVLVEFENRLYTFRWAEVNFVYCGIEGYSEHRIFEHIFSSWKFDQ